MRQQFQNTHLREAGISTHAPLTGCDLPWACRIWWNFLFQPTHPSRGATRAGMMRRCRRKIFQPTHPSRGATCVELYAFPVVSFQPTHPSRGATRRIANPRPVYQRFQPTHPSRGATNYNKRERTASGISTHAPLTGCDWYFTVRLVSFSISTHAPLTGCDYRRYHVTTDD